MLFIEDNTFLPEVPNPSFCFRCSYFKLFEENCKHEISGEIMLCLYMSYVLKVYVFRM